jgi:low affinity Fe/Cu permease
MVVAGKPSPPPNYHLARIIINPRDTLDWHAVATLSVWFMTLLIQRAEHRDTQALQAKLDELLHAHGRADNALTRIDEKEPEDIERHRDQARALD